MARLFISYSHKNSDFVQTLAKSLLDVGADLFVDQEGIRPGQDWGKAIQGGLDTAELMLLILSPDALESRHVDAEWGYFYDQEKPILPILHQSISKFPFQLNRLQYIDFVNADFNTAFGRLCEALHERGVALTVSAVQTEAAPVPPVPVEAVSPPAPLPAAVEESPAEISLPPIVERPKPKAKAGAKSPKALVAESPKPPPKKRPATKRTPPPAAESVKPAAQKPSTKTPQEQPAPSVAEYIPYYLQDSFNADVQTNCHTELMNKPGGAATREGNVSWHLPTGTKLHLLQYSQDKKWAQVETRSGRIGWVVADDLWGYSRSSSDKQLPLPDEPVNKLAGKSKGYSSSRASGAPATSFTPNAVISIFKKAELRVSPDDSARCVPSVTLSPREKVEILSRTGSGHWYEIVNSEGKRGWLYHLALEGLDGKPIADQVPDLLIRVRGSERRPIIPKSHLTATYSKSEALKDIIVNLGCLLAPFIAILAVVILIIVWIF
ncbi:MAG: hypothetical protein BroJett018_27000 [Chloroflexota bacterium]|nr:MAG: hypothetical protein BroJett018_27000 [Chloroflexota bacterium]